MNRQAERRRAWLMARLFRVGEIDLEELANDGKFVRSFGHPSAQTLYTDLQKIQVMLDNQRWGILTRRARGLRVALADQLSYHRLGYQVSFVEHSVTHELNRIASYIVAELFKPEDVVYLSTGTTVFQIAVELLRSRDIRAHTVITNNLAIAELWRNAPRHVSERLGRIRLIILGGEPDFEEAHVSLDPDMRQFEQFRVTKTVMSCTSIVPATGEVASSTLPSLKKLVLQRMVNGDLIIPAGKNEIGAAGGGDRLTLPGKDVRKHIVTSTLSDDDRDQLRGHGFEVHTVA